ncbi:Hypothetical predicted protein [Olea europaea subsp. europaea]|uniref:Uncharacterized protein n=1 Tax=Olea europaea subsp. europaea TaxID=158383 RepID=A0A8S0QBF2_OLEEU|nr:Hypothetical predicted protein [Olea europaea subsp. europaea]
MVEYHHRRSNQPPQYQTQHQNGLDEDIKQLTLNITQNQNVSQILAPRSVIEALPTVTIRERERCRVGFKLRSLFRRLKEAYASKADAICLRKVMEVLLREISSRSSGPLMVHQNAIMKQEDLARLDGED